MISLDQIRALESRVEKAVTLIASLRAENASMRLGLSTAESRVAELEGLVADFQCEQEKIEEGIIAALRKLDSFEDSVHESVILKAQGTGKPSYARADDPAKAQEAAQSKLAPPKSEHEAVDEGPAIGTEDEAKSGDSSDSLDIF